MTPSSETSPKVALVTGASRGLGSTVARLLAGEGFDLVLNARGTDPLDAIARELRGVGTEIQTVAGDVAISATRTALASEVDRLGRLDLLVNNASELGPSPLSPLSRIPLEQLERVYAVNVVAPLALVQVLEPYLARSHGLIVNVSSDAAVGAYPGWGAYGASKAALDLVSRTLARELEDRSIAVVSVDPGDMRTAMHQAAFPGEDISDRPLPEATLPFWVWLLGRPHIEVSGQRFRAQSDHWAASA
jgi:NAD(P)-dependent dehydrogenase (short-subunit alcohol dehydrogenase family)